MILLDVGLFLYAYNPAFEHQARAALARGGALPFGSSVSRVGDDPCVSAHCDEPAGLRTSADSARGRSNRLRLVGAADGEDCGSGRATLDDCRIFSLAHAPEAPR